MSCLATSTLAYGSIASKLALLYPLFDALYWSNQRLRRQRRKSFLERDDQINSCATKLQGCHYVEDVDLQRSSGGCAQECRGCYVNGTKYESGKSWRQGGNVNNLFFLCL